MSADEKTLDRVRKLIALTASPEEHEQISCARLACEKIREHGIVLVAEEPETNGTATELRTLRVQVQQQQVVIEGLRQELRIRAITPPKAPRAPRKPAAPAAAVPAPSKPAGAPGSRFQPMNASIPGGSIKPPPAASKPQSAKAKSMDGFYDEKKITAKFASKCRACGVDIDEGDQVIWTPGEGVQCLECGER